MAFPQVITVAHSQTTTDQTSHTVTLPSGIGAGDLLLMWLAFNGTSGAVNTPSGWTPLQAAAANNANGYPFYRIADGSEGASVAVTTTTAQELAATVYRIEGHDSTTNPPSIPTSWNSGTTSAPDAGNLTPAGGAKDYLWFCAVAADSGFVITATDGSFGNLLTSDSGSNANASAAISTARRELNASSLNPGAFTLEGAEGWLAVCLAVHPGTEGNPVVGEPKKPKRIYVYSQAVHRASRW
jgi:hypothetical protein